MLSLLLALLIQQPAYRTGPVQPPAVAAPGMPSRATGGYRIAPEAEGAEGDRRAPATPPPQLARTGVLIDAYDRTIESRWGADDPFYNGTVRGGAALAQSRQGPLDGGWTLLGSDGAALFALQLVDTGEGGVEGAWRDARPSTAGPATAGPATRPEASGFIAAISREPGRAVLRFLEPGASAPTVVSVSPALDGRWRGTLARDNGSTAPVEMRRR